MLKNILLSIDKELQEFLTGDVKHVDKKIINLLSFYLESIYKSGKLVINKYLGKSIKDIIFYETDNEYIKNINLEDINIKINSILNNNELSKMQIYKNLVYLIFEYCIKIFKIAQIRECKNLNIKQVKIISDPINSCDYCRTLSKLILDVNKINLDNIHVFCKLTIFPICIDKQVDLEFKNICKFNNVPIIYDLTIKNIIMKLRIYLKDFITFKTFKFVNNLKDDIVYDNDIIFISFNAIGKIDLDKIMIQELLKDKLFKLDLSWWKQEFKKIKSKTKISNDYMMLDKHLINNLCLYNWEDYFIQSYVSYILNAKELKKIDIKCYKQLYFIFKKEFVRG